MTGASLARRVGTGASAVAGRLGPFLASAGKAFLFSLADDTVSFRKGFAVSIEKGGITAVYGSRFLSRISAKNAREVPADPEVYPDPDACASAVAVAAAEMGAGKPSLTLSLPKAWTMATIAEFPVTIRENFADAIRFELDRLTPFTPDEAIYDFRLLTQTADKLRVLVVAAKAATVLPYLHALQEKGLTVSRVTSSVSSVASSFQVRRGISDFIFLKETEAAYEGTLFINGLMQNIFSVGKESRTGAGPPPALLQEVESLAAEMRTHQRQPHLLLASEPSGRSLKDLLSRKTSFPLTLTEDLMQEKVFKPEDKGRFFSAYSSLIEFLRPTTGGIDLLSHGVRKKERAPVLLTVLLAVALLASGFFYLYMPLQIEKKRTAGISQQIASKKGEVKKVEELKKEIDALTKEISSIETFKAKKPLSLNIVKEVTSILPNTAWLTRLRVSETQVDIEGYAGSATELIPKLEASKHLSKVEIASTTFRDQRLNADRFVIRTQIESAIREEPAAEEEDDDGDE